MLASKFFLTMLLLPVFLFSEILADVSEESPTVLLAILARNKGHTLPAYLKCIENLDYDKKKIALYINTNNNTDNTEEILLNWILQHQHEYASVEIDIHHVRALEANRPHEWTTKRFKNLALIRNKSLQKAIEKETDFYFVVDCDNFIAPHTLSTLTSKNKPIIAPLLKAIPEPNDMYSNFFCAVTDSGYYADHADYAEFWTGHKKGTFEVPVVHCTYLIRKDALPLLSYIDGTDDYEFVIFSREARKHQISQFICNEHSFGSLIHLNGNLSLNDEKIVFEQLIASKIDLFNPRLSCQDVFSHIYKNKIWGENDQGEGFSGPGSSLEQTTGYRAFLQQFLADHHIQSVVDVGCGDWTFSHAIDWTGIDYRGFDVVKDVIQRNNELYGTSSIHFEVTDATQPNRLPSADLFICKEVLQHLPFEDIAHFLENLKAYQYCLITNDINPYGPTINSDIERGGYRYLDLREPPFSLEAEEVFNYYAYPFLKQVLLIKKEN
jgi:SAM-dependent methyltransferase